jgi:hypothetical protein
MDSINTPMCSAGQGTCLENGATAPLPKTARSPEAVNDRSNQWAYSGWPQLRPEKEILPCCSPNRCALH